MPAIPSFTGVVEAPSQAKPNDAVAINRFDAGTRMVPGRGITEIGRGSHELQVFVRRDPLKVFPVLRGDSWGQVGLLFEIRLVVPQEVARVVGYILKECLREMPSW